MAHRYANKFRELQNGDLIKLLIKTGYGDLQHIVKEQNIDGAAFLNISEYNVMQFPGDKLLKKKLWSCIMQIRKNPTLFLNECTTPVHRFSDGPMGHQPKRLEITTTAEEPSISNKSKPNTDFLHRKDSFNPKEVSEEATSKIKQSKVSTIKSKSPILYAEVTPDFRKLLASTLSAKPEATTKNDVDYLTPRIVPCLPPRNDDESDYVSANPAIRPTKILEPPEQHYMIMTSPAQSSKPPEYAVVIYESFDLPFDTRLKLEKKDSRVSKSDMDLTSTSEKKKELKNQLGLPTINRSASFGRAATGTLWPKHQGPKTHFLPRPPRAFPDITDILDSPERPFKSPSPPEINLNNVQFYRCTDRKGARLILENLDDGAFLLRKCSSPMFFLALSVMYQNFVCNLGIVRTEKYRYRLNASEKSKLPNDFGSLDELIDYYTKETVPLVFNDEIIYVLLKKILPDDVF